MIMAYLGLLKVIENILRVYWFPRMKVKVGHYIDNIEAVYII